MNDIIIKGEEIKQRIISEINNARQHVYVAMAWFTDRDIASAIIDAKKRGVTVDIVLSSNSQNETVKLMFRGADINVHAFETGDDRGMMHHKFCLIDDRISINGSYNYSYNASNNNVENIHVSDDPSTYKQLLSEFERIRYNIDNNIAVNTIDTNMETPIQSHTAPEPQVPDSDSFYQQLYNLVYSSAQINTEEYKKRGYQKSEESGGNIDIFESEYKNIREEIRVFATDDSLMSKKNILLANIANAFEHKKTEFEVTKNKEIDAVKRSTEIEKRHLNERMDKLKQEKTILQSGNTDIGEKGLLQINKDIEKNRLEYKALEQSLTIKPFWSVGTGLVSLCLSIFAIYLSLFFGSAVYKVLFEGNVIRTSLEAGVNPGLPQLVDANAIIKIFRQQGELFGFIAIVFFLFPVLLSNIKILGSENKWINWLLFWVGLLIFDISVAAMIAFNTDEIKSLLVGKESELQLWEVVKHGEFWMIFVFGMMPLIITHYLIEYLHNAYKKSQKHLVDAEKAKRLKLLDDELIDLTTSKTSISDSIKEKDGAIKDNSEKIMALDAKTNNYIDQTEIKYAERLHPIKTLYEEFYAKIVSGRIFTDEILLSVVSAIKTGFIDFLPTYYAEAEVANRVRKIEQVISSIK